MLALTADMDRVAWRCRPASAGTVHRVESFPERYRLDSSRFNESVTGQTVRPFDAIPVGNTSLLKAIYPDQTRSKMKDELIELSTQLRRIDSELKHSRSETRSSLRANAHLRDSNSRFVHECEQLREELNRVTTEKKPIKIAKPVSAVCPPIPSPLIVPVTDILHDRIAELEASESKLLRVISEQPRPRPPTPQRELNLVSSLDCMISSLPDPTIPLFESLDESKNTITSLTRDLAQLTVENGALRRKLMLSLYHEKQHKTELVQLGRIHQTTLDELSNKSNQIKSIQNGNGPYLRKIKYLGNTIDDMSEEIIGLKKRLLKVHC